MLSLVSILLTVGAALAARNPRLDSDLLPGWGGSDLPIPGPRRQGCPSGNLTVLDAQARIFLCQGFITDAEADHIREISERRLRRSNVVDTGTGSSKTSNIRTSYGVFLGRGEDPIIADIERRIAEWTLLPVENGEGLQVLRYELDQKYDAHHDYFFHEEGVANGGNRYATVLTYLADTEEGGETVFPNVAAPGGVNPGMSECAKYHLAARPKKGNAVLFHSIKPSGELERKSLHGACPVLKGTKWSAAKWIHVGKYAMNGEKPQRIEQTINQVPRRTVPDGCEDLNDLCPEWMRAGECERNPSYMIGTRARPGQCVFSCNACDLVQDSGAREVYQINN